MRNVLYILVVVILLSGCSNESKFKTVLTYTTADNHRVEVKEERKIFKDRRNIERAPMYLEVEDEDYFVLIELEDHKEVFIDGKIVNAPQMYNLLTIDQIRNIGFNVELEEK